MKYLSDHVRFHRSLGTERCLVRSRRLRTGTVTPGQRVQLGSVVFLMTWENAGKT
jgi:hypothetical protein